MINVTQNKHPQEVEATPRPMGDLPIMKVHSIPDHPNHSLFCLAGLVHTTYSDEYTSLGCFKDSGNDRVLGNKMDDGVMTTKVNPYLGRSWPIQNWC